MRGYAPVCDNCAMPYESTADPLVLKCPICLGTHHIEQPVGPDAIPKCTLCGRRCKPCGELFRCPHCNVFFDGIREVTTASYNPERRALRDEERTKKQKHPANHRGGTFERWKRK